MKKDLEVIFRKLEYPVDIDKELSKLLENFSPTDNTKNQIKDVLAYIDLKVLTVSEDEYIDYITNKQLFLCVVAILYGRDLQEEEVSIWGLKYKERYLSLFNSVCGGQPVYSDEFELLQNTIMDIRNLLAKYLNV